MAIIPYATRTGSPKNIAIQHAAGWRLLINARDVWEWRLALPEGMGYCIDNGAWGYHNAGQPFDEVPFLECCQKLGGGADFITVPDIVEGGLDSLQLSLYWLPMLREFGVRLLIPVQDGMTVDDLRPLVGDDVGVFVGGSTEFKVTTLYEWAQLPCYCHVGRVNTRRRIRACHNAGVDSIDGTSTTKWIQTLPKLDEWVRDPQGVIEW